MEYPRNHHGIFLKMHEDRIESPQKAGNRRHGMCARLILQMTRNENVTDESWFTSLTPLTHISA